MSTQAITQEMDLSNILKSKPTEALELVSIPFMRPGIPPMVIKRSVTEENEDGDQIPDFRFARVTEITIQLTRSKSTVMDTFGQDRLTCHVNVLGRDCEVNAERIIQFDEDTNEPILINTIHNEATGMDIELKNDLRLLSGVISFGRDFNKARSDQTRKAQLKINWKRGAVKKALPGINRERPYMVVDNKALSNQLLQPNEVEETTEEVEETSTRMNIETIIKNALFMAEEGTPLYYIQKAIPQDENFEKEEEPNEVAAAAAAAKGEPWAKK